MILAIEVPPFRGVRSQGGVSLPFVDFLGRLLRKAFEDYDLENMVTAFLIVRQAALEGPAIFVPYSEWFQVKKTQTQASGRKPTLHVSAPLLESWLLSRLPDS